MMSLIISVLAFVLVALVSGNTLPGCVGSLISSKIIRFRSGALIAIAGYLLGFELQGSLLRSSLMALMPETAYSFVIIALAVTTVIFLIAHKLRVSISLAITLTMTLIGISIASSQQINSGYAVMIVLFWISAAILSFALSALAVRYVPIALKGRHVWPTLATIRILLVAISFFTAFSIGGNAIGLIFVAVSGYVSPLVIIAGIILGSILMGAGELKRLGNDVLPLRYLNALILQAISFGLVEAATLAGIPLSINQTVTSSIYGAGMGYRTKLIRSRPKSTIMATWIVTALVSLGLGFAVTYACLLI